MIAFVVRRLLWGVVLLCAMSFTTFVLFAVIPEDRADLGRGFASTEINLRQAASLDSAPLPEQWAQYVWNAVRHFSLGRTFRSQREVTDIVGDAVPVTASLILGGTVFFLLMAIPIGIVSALRPRSVLDRFLMIFVLIGISCHPAWLGLMLSYFFGYRWGVTPLTGYCDFISPSTDCGGPVDWASHLLLPWLTYAILFAALYARMIRASVIESLGDDYVRTARAKGGSGWHVIRHHVLQNAALPVVTMIGMDVGLAFAGSVFVETVYGLPGVGRMLTRALAQHELPVLLAGVLVVTSAIVVFNLLVDLLYTALDPRVRVTARSHDFGDSAAGRSPAPTSAVAAGRAA